jgi:hypothetical protein
MDRRVVLIGGGLALIAGALLWPRKKKSAEDEVRELIAGCVLAAEKRDLGALTDAIADDFHGPSGSSKQEVKQVLLGQLFRNQNVVVVLNPTLDVKAQGDDATFSGVFVFARGRDVNWQEPGDGVSRYDIEGALQRRGGDWKIISADWHRP